jgi:catechol 2,3-dioxygenase-like lactoylglutathione lyase family enzyme
MSKAGTAQTPATDARPVETKLEVVVIPVSDVDRAKAFYQSLGWRLDADFVNADGSWRVIQVTPPGSPCSVIFGKGITPATPGSTQGLFLVVDDLAAARAEIAGHGIDISEVFHFEGGLHVVGNDGRAEGADPGGQSYRSWASFTDPDGNGWLLQEIKTRLPGRGFSSDVASMTDLLREAEEQHGRYEPTAPKHHWSGFYAAYVIARQRGNTPDEAAQAGARTIAEAGR